MNCASGIWIVSVNIHNIKEVKVLEFFRGKSRGNLVAIFIAIGLKVAKPWQFRGEAAGKGGNGTLELSRVLAKT